MAWYNAAVNLLTGGIVEQAGKIIDDLHTSTEEKNDAKHKLQELANTTKIKATELENKYQEEITKRWEADSKSSWLAKNVRPLSLIYLLMVISALAFTDGNIGQFQIDKAYVSLFQSLALVAFGAYFGGRTYEKYKGVTK